MTTITQSLTQGALGIEGLLRRVAEAVQLSTESHALAHRAYADLGARLASGELESLDPLLFGQGSYMLGTTVRPLGREEFDLDSVLQLSGAWGDPERFIEFILPLVLAAAPNGSRPDPRDRCVRFLFAGRFHLDVVLAVAAGSSALSPTAIFIPARTSSGWSWQLSDPKAYEAWFARQARSSLLIERALKAAEPLPQATEASEKSPLQIAVQLIKRHHRLHVTDEELQTPSILLTTLAAQPSYSPGSILDAMSVAVGALVIAARAHTPPEVRNPVLEEEIISRKWHADARVYSAFRSQVRQLEADWSALHMASGRGLPAVTERLTGMFGENDVRTALKALGSVGQGLGSAGAFSVGSTGALRVARGAAAPSPRHTNFGNYRGKPPSNRYL